MAFQLVKILFTKILVKSVLNGLKASYTPDSNKVPATIPRTSVALCLTVPSESFSRDFKLAPMPGNRKSQGTGFW